MLDQSPTLPSITWTRESSLIWKADLGILTPGTYSTRAEIGTKKATTNRVSFDVPHRFLLTPNPTQGKIKLSLTQEFSELTKIYVIRLDGLPISTINLPAFTSTKELDMGNLKNGTYLIRLENSSYSGQQKFIKQ